MSELAEATSRQTWGAELVLVPVGSIEQHGPHLPLDTDTAIAVAVAGAVAERLEAEVLVAPPVSYGSSGEHQDFAGTSSIGSEVLRALAIELVRSMSTWAGRIVFVNAHGGNISALSKATFQMIAEGHDVAWVPCATEDFDLHAGHTETSLMLHIRPASVMAGGVAAVSPNGILGDPTTATREHGAEVLSAMVDQIVAQVLHAQPDAHGMLARIPAASAQ
jgi:mycofactocin system creatininase family protein